jgi:hypothetical protein
LASYTDSRYANPIPEELRAVAASV